MSLTINGATNTLTASSGLTIAGNTAVTGTLSASGLLTANGGSPGNPSLATQFQMSVGTDIVLNPSGYGVVVSGSRVVAIDTTGLAVTGTLSATGAITSNDGTVAMRAIGFVDTGYIGTTSNHPVAIQVNNSTIAAVTSTGLAVTGALSATSGSGNAVIMNHTNSGAVGNPVQRSGVTKGYLGLDVSDNFGLLDSAGTLRAAVSTTGLAVTGTLSATGIVSTTSTTGFSNVSDNSTYKAAFTGNIQQATLGSDGSTGAYVGTLDAYDFKILRNSSVIGTFSASGLAVTGTLSATGFVGINGGGTTNAALSIGTDLGAITTAGRMLQIGHASGGGLFIGKDNTDYSYLIHDAATSTSQWVMRGGAISAILSSTGLAVTGLLDLSAASSGQIKFPATQNASADANTLDDYEEGTFTCAWEGTTAAPTTPVTATGSYVKIGKQVTVTVDFPASDLTGATGNVKFTGLPFATDASKYHVGAMMLSGHSTTSPIGYIGVGDTNVLAVESTTDGYVPIVAAAGKSARFTITYISN